MRLSEGFTALLKSIDWAASGYRKLQIQNKPNHKFSTSLRDPHMRGVRCTYDSFSSFPSFLFLSFLLLFARFSVKLLSCILALGAGGTKGR